MAAAHWKAACATVHWTVAVDLKTQQQGIFRKHAFFKFAKHYCEFHPWRKRDSGLVDELVWRPNPWILSGP
jgi:hypothetical protein